MRRKWQKQLIIDLNIAPVILDGIFPKEKFTTQHEIDYCKNHVDGILLFPDKHGVLEEFHRFREIPELLKK